MSLSAFDSIEIYDSSGELDGYVLVEVRNGVRVGAPITPVRSTRSSAWADATLIVKGPHRYYFVPQFSSEGLS